MLIETFNTGDVVTLKMISGEEVIARFVEQFIDKIVVTRPLVLMQGPNGMGLAPFVITVKKDDHVGIFINGVTAFCKSDEEMSAQYLEVTTGITLAVENSDCKIHTLK